MPGPAPDDPLPLSDDDLVDLLGQTLADDDPLPPHLLAVAQEAFAWREPDIALADLIDASTPAGVRGGPQHLEFATGDGRHIEIELRPAGGHAVAVGQVTPAEAPASASTSTSGSTWVSWTSPERSADPTPVGTGGFFELTDVPRGPVRFTVTVADGPTLHTVWVIA